MDWVFTAALAAMLCVPRCADGAEWLQSYPDALQLAGRQAYPLCLYFCSAGSAACQRFDSEVLSQPAFDEALRGFVAVRLDPARHESLIEQYAVYRVPAVVLTDSAGNVLYSEQGKISAAGLLQALKTHAKRPGNPPEVSHPARPASPRMRQGELFEESGVRMVPVVAAPRLQPVLLRVQAPGAESLVLYYRIPQETAYLSSPMRQTRSDEWEGEIPGWIVTPKGVEYYLLGRRDGERFVVPARYNEAPFRIEVQ